MTHFYGNSMSDRLCVRLTVFNSCHCIVCTAVIDISWLSKERNSTLEQQPQKKQAVKKKKISSLASDQRNTVPFYSTLACKLQTYLLQNIPVVCRPHEHQQCPNHHHRLFPTLLQSISPLCLLLKWSHPSNESHSQQSSLDLLIHEIATYNITCTKVCSINSKVLRMRQVHLVTL